MNYFKNNFAIFTITILILISFAVSSFLNDPEEKETNDWVCNLPKDSALREFKNKILLNPYPNFSYNPYKNQTKEFNEEIKETLENKNIVCAFKYINENRTLYQIENFLNKKLAEENGYIVTHQGQCGACSNLNDLAVYLSRGLTSPVRKCGFLTIISDKLALNCLKKIGFTNSCAQIWLFNAINTRQNCFTTCMISWIKNEPFADKDGKMNKCINCDEVISGPVFQYFSGRTRRNSGIESEIKRPGEQIYNITHCYY